MRAVIRGVAGEGPPLVYVPGLDGTGEMLFSTGDRLANRFRLARLAYENGGGQVSYERLARSVVTCLDELDIERAAVLCESFGGGVALRTALDFPDRVASLAIVNGFPHFARRVRLALTRLGVKMIRHWPFLLGRRPVARWVFFGRDVDERALAGIVSLGSELLDPGYHERLRMIAGLDLRPRLHEIRQPVTLFASDRDRVVDSVRQARRMVEVLPNATMRKIPNGGHIILPLPSLPWEEWLAERSDGN